MVSDVKSGCVLRMQCAAGKARCSRIASVELHSVLAASDVKLSWVLGNFDHLSTSGRKVTTGLLYTLSHACI